MKTTTTLKECSIALAVLLSIAATPTFAGNPFITAQSTTSTQNSGLYDYILPEFTSDSGIDVHVVAVGTGQAMKNGANCDGDVLVVHAKSAEEKFIAAGYGVKRTDLMYNDFIIVGPANDPARVANTQSVVDALKVISNAKAAFASRGDDSGTNKKEIALWKAAGINPTGASGKWYRETGSGMGATLNVSVGMGAYTLTDRATWLKFGNKGDYKILSQGDPSLFNQYGIILVNPERCPNIKVKLAKTFINWMLSERGQKVIGSYRAFDTQLFHPNAPKN